MEEPPISKRKLKKLKRDQQWEDSREQRKTKRKEKIREKKERKRAAHRAGLSNDVIVPVPSDNASHNHNPHNPRDRKNNKPVQLPITIILDCGFDEIMSEKEYKSLNSQITRCYSDNQKAPYKAHLVISSFGGRLKERFESILSGHYSSWKGVKFLEEDFYEVGDQAKKWMREFGGGELSGALRHEERPDQPSGTIEQEAGELIYLTSDSPNILTELKPYSTYVIGGLVDRNRHKGICYKRAMDRGVKTAKLPIGGYMEMTSRFVLATNHVSEILLRWLELGDWGGAFLRVIPKRKGGVLKGGQMGDDVGTGTGLEDHAIDYDNEEELKQENREHENSQNDHLEETELGAGIEEKRDQRTSGSSTQGTKLDEEVIKSSIIPSSSAKPDEKLNICPDTS